MDGDVFDLRNQPAWKRCRSTHSTSLGRSFVFVSVIRGSNQRGYVFDPRKQPQCGQSGWSCCKLMGDVFDPHQKQERGMLFFTNRNYCLLISFGRLVSGRKLNPSCSTHYIQSVKLKTNGKYIWAVD